VLDEFFDPKHIEPTREFCKWLLEMLRNLVVVAVFQTIATKADSWPVWVLAKITSFALTAYVISYPIAWMAKNLRRGATASLAGFFLSGSIFMVITIVASQAISFELIEATRQIASVQK
jgi:hypothetical protein